MDSILEKIYDLIDEWHNQHPCDTNYEPHLYKYLGMTWYEYKIFVEKSEIPEGYKPPTR